MAENRVQFQKGLSRPDFFAAYGSEAQSAETLFRGRWPLGFVCPACGHAEAGYTTIHRRGLLQCKHYRHQTSLTAGTVFAASKLPLTTWFLALYLLTQQKNAISAIVELMRELGVSCNTAWSLKHKLLQTMLECDANRQLTGVIKVDDVYWGRGCHGQTPGRGSPDKDPLCCRAGQEPRRPPAGLAPERR